MSSRNPDEARVKRRGLLPWAVFGSLLLHGAAYASLEPAPAATRPAHLKAELRFDVVATPTPKPAAPTPPPPPPPPATSKPPPRGPKPASAPPIPPQAEPAQEPKAPAGVTLAGEGPGNAFAMPVGAGGPLEPSRTPPSLPAKAPPPVEPAPIPPPRSPAIVAVSDLSAKPTPPSLGPALERNYPADARRRGLSGTAKVRARIDPDGVVRHVALLEESATGFGSACGRTLHGSRWAAPKDKAGRPVATEIRYTCRFVVDP